MAVKAIIENADIQIVILDRTLGLGFKSNCYDRNDNPSEYCDNYAVEESSKKWTASFCQNICNNYDDVLAVHN